MAKAAKPDVEYTDYANDHDLCRDCRYFHPGPRQVFNRPGPPQPSYDEDGKVTRMEPTTRRVSGKRGTCDKVEGAISPGGWCKLFERVKGSIVKAAKESNAEAKV